MACGAVLGHFSLFKGVLPMTRTVCYSDILEWCKLILFGSETLRDSYERPHGATAGDLVLLSLLNQYIFTPVSTTKC